MIASAGRYVGLLRQPDYRRLWLAASVSAVGSEVTALALPLVAILVLKASAFEVAALAAAQLLAFALFALPAGVWADRVSRKGVLVVTDLGRAAILILVPVAGVAGILSMPLLYVIAFAASTLTVFFGIAHQAILPEIVDRDRLAEGNSRLSLSASTAQVIGPSIGGFLVGVLTAPVAIVVDALSFLGSAAFLFGMRTSRPRPAHATRPRASLVQEIVVGLRFYRGNRLLMAASSAVVSLNFGFHLASSIFLVFLVRELAMSPQNLGLALSVGSIGAVIGAAGASALGRRFGLGPVLIVGCGVTSAAWLLIVFASPATAFALLATATLIQGFIDPVVFVNFVAFRQTVTPDELLGRVNATARWLHWVAIPLGSLLGGVLATGIGLRSTIAVGACIALLSVVFVVFSPLRSVREMPGAPQAPLPVDNPLDGPPLPLGLPPT